MTTVAFTVDDVAEVTDCTARSVVAENGYFGCVIVEQGSDELSVRVDSVAMARELASAFAHVGDELADEWPQSGRSCGHLHCADSEGHIDECLGDDAT